MRNLKIASAVALALGAAGAHAAAPTLIQCQTANETLYVAGSSAAQNAFANALNTDLFGGSGVTYTGSAGNFRAYCGLSSNPSVAPVGTPIVVHYRAEGGSVVGALPVVSGQPIQFLDLSKASAGSTTIGVTGNSATNGVDDSWSGGVTKHVVEVGVTDVEPAQLVGANYPKDYSSAVFGSASASQLAGLTKTALFDQVFALFVNTSGINGGGSGQAIDLSRETAAAVLTGKYTDWASVPTASGGRVSSVSAPITVINREAGSGTRTGASIYFLGYNCSQVTAGIPKVAGQNEGFQTSDVLASAGATPGAITYASIDNAGKPSLSTVSINGVAPSNLAATSGAYEWWFEAQLIKGAVQTADLPIYNFLVTELASVNTAPHSVQILAIPGVGSPANKAVVPVVPNTAQPGAAIYINPFTRGSNSCAVPKSTN